MLLAADTGGQTAIGRTAIDQAVLSKVSEQFGINSEVIVHLDLTQPFRTKSQWTLVVAKQPDEESAAVDGLGERKGAISFCLVEKAEPQCSEEMHGAGPFYELFTSDIVFSGRGKTLPLLRIKTCTMGGANGNCGVSTFLFAYDSKADRFNVVFFNILGRNNNEETRFIENGPLLGSVIVAYPTNDPPFVYDVEVYRRAPAHEQYAAVLRYRGHTVYGDGNPLAVIDSEMPEILRRLGLWKKGEPLPIPPHMPATCKRLVLRKSVEWCEGN